MKRVFVYIAIVLFVLSITGIIYTYYIESKQTESRLLADTEQSAIIAKEVRARLEETALKIKTKLEADAVLVKQNFDETNKLIVSNQESLKLAVKEIIQEQFRAASKELITREGYTHDQLELNYKLNKILQLLDKPAKE